MASISPPFILCPLPDRQALLGIRPDRLPNKAIITLGRNIAIRYHVLEQKQESSWTTSTYWFTSPVTYCYDLGKYGAVLNNNVIALWEESDTSLSNITKLKLPDSVFGLYTNSAGRTIVVMNKGNVAYFTDVLENKNIVKAPVLDPKETLISFEINEKNNDCYLITKKDVSKKLCVVFRWIKKESNKDYTTTRLTFGNDSQEILGFCLLLNDSGTSVVYFSSDGHVYRRNLQGSKSECEPVKLANLKSYVNKQNPVIIRQLNDNSNNVAIYGCDPSEEGAVALIYDIHYDVVVSKQPLKLYANPPMMEQIGNSLFVPLGLHILVLNYKTTKSLLSSVVGKHQATLNEEVFEGRNPWISGGWDADGQTPTDAEVDSDENLESLKEAYPSIWGTIQQVKLLESEGQPEAVICNNVIPAALENGNGAALDWILNTFLDIPEVHIVSMVVFSLRDIRTSSPDGDLLTVERLDQLLVRKFDKNLLTLSLRHVDYDDTKKLLQYINTLIKNQWELDVESEEDNSPMTSWLKWCSCLVDAHYTKFVLHNDTDIIDNLLGSVSECTSVMKTVEEMEPFLAMTYSKTSFEPTNNSGSRWRTETFTFV